MSYLRVRGSPTQTGWRQPKAVHVHLAVPAQDVREQCLACGQRMARQTKSNTCARCRNVYQNKLISGKQIAEHRVVMEQMLGRPLREGENVHHVNGLRWDNRPENLELWSKKQPPGQRVVDKVAWAIEFLATSVRGVLMRSVYWQATRTVPRPPKPLGAVSQSLPLLLWPDAPEIFDATGNRVMF